MPKIQSSQNSNSNWRSLAEGRGGDSESYIPHSLPQVTINGVYLLHHCISAVDAAAVVVIIFVIAKV